MAFQRFLIKRSVHGLGVLFALATLLFGIRVIYPGDPATLLAGEEATQEAIEAVRADLGLDRPISVQYVDFIAGLVQGDLGNSFVSGTSVVSQILSRLPATIELAVAATVISILLAIPFGIISATNRNTRLDSAVTLSSLMGVSTPNFWLGIMLILAVPVALGIGPTGGREIGFYQAGVMLATTGNFYGLYQWTSHMILPAVTLGTYYTALLTRLTRNGMLEEFGKMYITATKAKGLWRSIILYKHALRNTLAPLITILGLQLGRLIGGSVVVEEVFFWPGVGRLFIDAVRSLDWPMIQGTLLLTALAIVTANILVDASYTYLDPEVEY